MSKKLQLQRNNTTNLTKRSELIESYKNAVSADTEDKFVDGQVFVIRYIDDNTNKIGAAICTVNVVDNSKYLTVSDCDLYEKIIDNEEVTEKAIGTLNDTIGGDEHLKINFDNVPIVSSDTSVKDAIITLANDLNSKTDKYVSGVSFDESGKTITLTMNDNTTLTANTNIKIDLDDYTLTSVTEELSGKVETLSGEVINNELVTSQALFKHNETIGADVNGNISFPETSVLKDITNIKDALLLLEEKCKLYWGTF